MQDQSVRTKHLIAEFSENLINLEEQLKPVDKSLQQVASPFNRKGSYANLSQGVLSNKMRASSKGAVSSNTRMKPAQSASNFSKPKIQDLSRISHEEEISTNALRDTLDNLYGSFEDFNSSVAQKKLLSDDLSRLTDGVV